MPPPPWHCQGSYLAWQSEVTATYSTDAAWNLIPYVYGEQRKCQPWTFCKGKGTWNKGSGTGTWSKGKGNASLEMLVRLHPIYTARKVVQGETKEDYMRWGWNIHSWVAWEWPYMSCKVCALSLLVKHSAHQVSRLQMNKRRACFHKNVKAMSHAYLILEWDLHALTGLICCRVSMRWNQAWPSVRAFCYVSVFLPHLLFGLVSQDLSLVPHITFGLVVVNQPRMFAV